MGGRGTAGKTKLFTNIDADRNKPFREVRAKELESERNDPDRDIKRSAAFIDRHIEVLSPAVERVRGYLEEATKKPKNNSNPVGYQNKDELKARLRQLESHLKTWQSLKFKRTIVDPDVAKKPGNYPALKPDWKPGDG